MSHKFGFINTRFGMAKGKIAGASLAAARQASGRLSWSGVRTTAALGGMNWPELYSESVVFFLSCSMCRVMTTDLSTALVGLATAQLNFKL
jgi:hypothetical protein